MMITVQLFAAAREALGGPQLQVNLPELASIQDLRGRLRTEFPALGAWITTTRIAVNLNYVSDTYQLQPGDHVAMIPPVSGG